MKSTNQETVAEMRAKTMQYITAGFSFVAGLAWNDAIRSLIDYLYPANKSGISAKFIYAIAVTIILVIVSVHLRKAFTVFERLKKSS